jgi:hypothetical protein
VASRRGLDALQVCVQCGAGGGARARERVARSARAGRHGHVGVAWLLRGVGWVQGGGVPWNWL